MEVNPNNDATGRMNCHYRSTLKVTAVAPGNYTYVASNRATSGDVRMSFVVEELAWSQETLIVRWNNHVLVNDSGYPQSLIYLNDIDIRTNGGDPAPDGEGVLICRYSMSNPDASWRKPNGDGITLSHNNDDFRQFGETGPRNRVQLARTSSLSQDDASNNGLWTCNAGGLHRHVPLYTRGSGIVTIDSLTLGASPSFSSFSPRFTLIADTSGGPATTFSWSNNARTISNNGSNSISIEVNPNNNTIGRMNCHYRSTLEVTAVAPGTYTYVVSNRVTSDIRMLFVVEGGNPSKLYGVQTGMNTIDLTWDPPPGPPSRGYRVVNSGNNISMNAMSNRLTINNLPPGYHSFQVTSLSQHFPHGIVGPEIISVRGAFTSNISLSQLTATSVNVSWTQPMFSFTVLRYVVTIRRLTDCNSLAFQTGPRNQTANYMTELFEGLEENINYRAEVTTTYQSPSFSFTVSPVTAEMEFTTLAIFPSEVPSNVVPITTSRTITVSWDAIDCGNQNGPNFHYDVDFQRMDGEAVPVGTVNNEMFTVEGLQPFTNYTFRVRGVNDAGNGGYTSLKVIQTNEEVPGNAVDLQVQLSTFTSVLITWSPPQEPNGIIIMYELTYPINETASMSENVTNRLSYTIESAVNTRIEVRVRAYTIVGPGPFVTANITLSPPIVMNVRVESLTDTSVEVFWDRFADILEITEYVVYYAPVFSSRKRQINEQSVTVPSTENSVELGCLESTVEYQYQVTAVAMFGGRRLEGYRSPVTNNSRHKNVKSGHGGREGTGFDVSVSVSVSVVVTFLLTVILNTTLLLGGYYFVCAHHNKGFKKPTSDTSGMAMKENAAYGPVTSSQQPHDYIFVQPDVKTETEYDIVK